MSTTSRQAVLAIGLAGLFIESIVSHPALATDKVLLYKVSGPQGEIVIGLTRDELDDMPGKDPAALTQVINEKGSLDVWQYGARRVASGEIEQYPRRKISLAANAALSIACYDTRDRIVPIADETMDAAVHQGTRL